MDEVIETTVTIFVSFVAEHQEVRSFMGGHHSRRRWFVRTLRLVARSDFCGTARLLHSIRCANVRPCRDAFDALVKTTFPTTIAREIRSRMSGMT